MKRDPFLATVMVSRPSLACFKLFFFILEGIRNAFYRSHPLQNPVSSHLQKNILCCIFNLLDVTKCIENISVTSHCMFSFSIIFTWRATTAVCLPLCGAQKAVLKNRAGRPECQHNQNSTQTRVRLLEIRSSPGAWVGRKEGRKSIQEWNPY